MSRHVRYFWQLEQGFAGIPLHVLLDLGLHCTCLVARNISLVASVCYYALLDAKLTVLSVDCLWTLLLRVYM